MDFNQMPLILPAVIIGLTVHEFAHAYTAYKLGDHTAKEQGRVTLNPLKHIDWLGFAFIVFAGFGWAKPVMFNPENLKKKHRDEILIALAGPISNLLLALLFILVARVLYGNPDFAQNAMGMKAVNMFLIWALINIGLFVFNMIPIPPLDGSHLYLSYLKATNPVLMQNLYRYGTMALFGIIILESVLNLNILPISELMHGILGFAMYVFGF